MKIQFGSGGNILPGWVNTDLEHAVAVKDLVDITKLLPYGNEVADEILAEHVCEHITPQQLLSFLMECRRILKPGGVLRMICPVVGPWLPKGLAIDLTVNHGHQIVMDQHIMTTFLWMAGFEEKKIVRTARKTIDGHFRMIGLQRDDLESCRMEATK